MTDTEESAKRMKRFAEGTDSVWCARCGEAYLAWAHDECPNCGCSTFKISETDGAFTYRLFRKMGLVT